MRETARRLEQSFERIAATRMRGLPFVNPALRVELVGLTEWNGEGIAVLVTPWAINAILIPGPGKWTSLPPGAERFAELPAGRFRFISARDEDAGEFHACSLFSATLGFEDHEAARIAARAALQALLTPGMEPARPLTRRDFLRGAARAGHAD